MKYLLILVTFLAFFITACGGDDENDMQDTTCEVSDFVSPWRGDVTCDSSSVDFQGFEFALDGNNELVFTYANFQIQAPFTVVRTNCNFEAEASWEDNSNNLREVTVEGQLVGNQFEVTITRVIGGVIDEKCSGTVFERY